MMDYITRSPTAKTGKYRVDGAQWMGNMWLIPKDTHKPCDMRLKANRKSGDKLD